METEVTICCDCCGLKEDCTEQYIRQVRKSFHGKWLCGLCSEAAKDELSRGRSKAEGAVYGVEEAVQAHMSFCSNFNCNPANRVADGMRQMLRRRSMDILPPRPSPEAPNDKLSKAGRLSFDVGRGSSSVSIHIN